MGNVIEKGVQKKAPTRYSDDKLLMFKQLIENKIAAAREIMENAAAGLSESDGSHYNVNDGGAHTYIKEDVSREAARQKKFIDQLEAALVRIANKTYGICRETSELIPEGRLLSVPHTTMCMEAKLKELS
ncbi:MAG: TraR/DksA family transcriptional regulator [Patescibacteria group bacterium]